MLVGQPRCELPQLGAELCACSEFSFARFETKVRPLGLYRGHAICLLLGQHDRGADVGG